MKYCPYCGADLFDGTASFCTECGKTLPEKKDTAVAEKSSGKKPSQKKPKQKKQQKKKAVQPPVMEKTEPAPSENDYDGYYDDVLPNDQGKVKEGIDKELVKKIAMITGVLLLIVGLCVAAMYLL